MTRISYKTKWSATQARLTATQYRVDFLQRELARLNHEPENAGERAALGAVEPRGVDLDHAGRAEGLKISVHEPDERKGRERSKK